MELQLVILLNLGIFSVGLVALYLGAKWLVTGATSLALGLGIRPLLVGITIVALATSMPEFVVNLMAAVTGEDGLALGNIIGSNISNIGLILGVSAVVIPLGVAPSILRKEFPIMLAVMILFYALSYDGLISKVDGALLTTGLVAFISFLIIDNRRQEKKKVPVVEDSVEDNADESAEEDQLTSTRSRVLYLLAGMIGLSLGARIMVYAAINIAESLSISDVVIGLTVVAIGTSLPELAASLACALNKQADMSVGNVLGSNLLNVLFVVGLVSLIRPLQVDAETISLHFPVMLVFSVLLLPIAWFSHKINRFSGALLILAFIGYIGYLIFLESTGA